MNRRSFIADMLKVGVACAFLPGAGRIWKPVLKPEHLLVMPGFPGFRVTPMKSADILVAYKMARAEMWEQFTKHYFPELT